MALNRRPEHVGEDYQVGVLVKLSWQQLLHMSKQTLRGNDSRTFELAKELNAFVDARRADVLRLRVDALKRRATALERRDVELDRLTDALNQ
ncbi:hypothetical protein Tco_0250304 [Tanacetum coccineum]